MMTPLEKARAEEGRVNYCDECEQFEIVGDFAYCKVDGKLIHPIMMMRGQGTGPAWNCKKRLKKKPKTRLEIVQSMTAEEFAKWFDDEYTRANWCDVDALINESCDDKPCVECIVKWLNEEAK